MKCYISKIFRLFFISLIAMTFCGCTHPNGDIGTLFGSWAFDEILVDGERLADYDEGIIVSFQGEMFLIEMTETYGYQCVFGPWERSGNEIKMDGTIYINEKNPDLTNTENLYPEALGVAPDEVFEVSVVSESRKKMIWHRTSIDGKVWEYHLRKLL